MPRAATSCDERHDAIAPPGQGEASHAPADPVLARLLDDVERAMTALRTYLAGEPGADDLVPLREAEREFHRSNDTVRRWAKEEGLGVEKGGRWYLRRSMVRRCKVR